MGDMFWYIAVSLVSVSIAWFIRKVQPVILQVFIALIVPVFASSLLSMVPELLKPSTPGENAFAWTLILAATWAMVAVPVCLVSVIAFNVLQRRVKPQEK